MISDRYYMRENNPARDLAPLLWLIGVLVGFFLIQRILDSIWPGFTNTWLALSPGSIRHGYIWTLATYSLLHAPDSLWHLIFNVLSIFFTGRLLLPAVGAKRMLWTYAASVVAGGILWLAVNFAGANPGHLLGASGGAFGLFALFCCRFAMERITLLMFYVIPVTVIPRYLLMVIGGIEALFFICTEVFPGPHTGFAHSAHVGGMLAAILAYRYMVAAEQEPVEPAEERRPAVELPGWIRKKNTPQGTGHAYRINLSERESLKAEVDRILDKINTSGFGSLTAEEKRTLDAARTILSKQ